MKNDEDNRLFYHEYSNATKYGIESVSLRYTWAGYYLFVILSSFIGDTTILVASIKYQAIKLHRVIVVIIQHIAVCDLMLSVDTIVSLGSILKGKWVFGSFLLYFTNYGEYYISSTSIFLIGAMTTSKLLLIQYPLRLGNTSSNKAHVLCGICWLLASIVPASLLSVDWKDVYFTYRGYVGEYGYTSNVWQYLKPPLAIFVVFTPVCLVAATSAHLLLIARKFARKDRQSLKWQGLITTVLTATVFFIAYLPYFLMLLLEPFFSTEFKRQRIYVYCHRVAVSCLPLNTLCNFYIYCLTVPSFRSFVLSRLQRFSRIFPVLCLPGKETTVFWTRAKFLFFDRVVRLLFFGYLKR